MAKNIDDKLVLAISSRALFDLSESHKVYLASGVEPIGNTRLNTKTKFSRPAMRSRWWKNS